jgi:hypothetical protein
MPSQTFTGERLPAPTAIADVLAIQRVIVFSGHIVLRITDVKNAPGADG